MAKKWAILGCLCLLAQLSSGQQSEQMQNIERVYNQYVDQLPTSIKNKNYSTTFQDNLEKFSIQLGEYLKAGSGLSFEEMNEVRKFRSKINTMADFTWLGGAERNCGWGEKKNLSVIQEIYPDVIVDNVVMGEGSCINVIRVQIGEYVFYAGTHDDKAHFKRIYYKVNYTKLSTASGYCGIQPGKYTKFCDNASQLTIKYFTPQILDCVLLDNPL